MFLRRGSWYSLGKVGALCCAFSFLPPLRPSQAQAYTNVHLISTWTQMHLHVTIVQLIPFTVIHGNYQGSMRKHRHNEQASHHAGGNNELVVCEKVGWLQERGLKMMWCLDVGRRVMSCSFFCIYMESSCVSSRRWWLGVAVAFTFLVLQAALGPGTISSGSGKWVCNCRRQRRWNRRRKTFSHSGTRPPCNNWRVASATARLSVSSLGLQFQTLGQTTSLYQPLPWHCLLNLRLQSHSSDHISPQRSVWAIWATVPCRPTDGIGRPPFKILWHFPWPSSFQRKKTNYDQRKKWDGEGCMLQCPQGHANLLCLSLWCLGFQDRIPQASLSRWRSPGSWSH